MLKAAGPLLPRDRRVARMDVHEGQPLHHRGPRTVPQGLRRDRGGRRVRALRARRSPRWSAAPRPRTRCSSSVRTSATAPTCRATVREPARDPPRPPRGALADPGAGRSAALARGRPDRAPTPAARRRSRRRTSPISTTRSPRSRCPHAPVTPGGWSSSRRTLYQWLAPAPGQRRRHQRPARRGRRRRRPHRDDRRDRRPLPERLRRRHRLRGHGRRWRTRSAARDPRVERPRRRASPKPTPYRARATRRAAPSPRCATPRAGAGTPPSGHAGAPRSRAARPGRTARHAATSSPPPAPAPARRHRTSRSRQRRPSAHPHVQLQRRSTAEVNSRHEPTRRSDLPRALAALASSGCARRGDAPRTRAPTTCASCSSPDGDRTRSGSIPHDSTSRLRAVPERSTTTGGLVARNVYSSTPAAGFGRARLDRQRPARHLHRRASSIDGASPNNRNWQSGLCDAAERQMALVRQRAAARCPSGARSRSAASRPTSLELHDDLRRDAVRAPTALRARGDAKDVTLRAPGRRVPERRDRGGSLATRRVEARGADGRGRRGATTRGCATLTRAAGDAGRRRSERSQLRRPPVGALPFGAQRLAGRPRASSLMAPHELRRSGDRRRRKRRHAATDRAASTTPAPDPLRGLVGQRRSGNPVNAFGLSVDEPPGPTAPHRSPAVAYQLCPETAPLPRRADPATRSPRRTAHRR